MLIASRHIIIMQGELVLNPATSIGLIQRVEWNGIHIILPKGRTIQDQNHWTMDQDTAR